MRNSYIVNKRATNAPTEINIIDFGAAFMAGNPDDSLLGTLPFMAPEMVYDRRNVSAKSDVFLIFRLIGFMLGHIHFGQYSAFLPTRTQKFLLAGHFFYLPELAESTKNAYLKIFQHALDLNHITRWSLDQCIEEWAKVKVEFTAGYVNPTPIVHASAAIAATTRVDTSDEKGSEPDGNEEVRPLLTAQQNDLDGVSEDEEEEESLAIPANVGVEGANPDGYVQPFPPNKLDNFFFNTNNPKNEEIMRGFRNYRKSIEDAEVQSHSSLHFFRGKRVNYQEQLNDATAYLESYVDLLENINRIRATDGSYEEKSCQIKPLVEHFITNTTPTFSNKVTRVPASKIAQSACVFIGIIIGAVIGAVLGTVAGIAIGALVGGVAPVFGNLVGAVIGGSTAAVAGAITGAGIGSTAAVVISGYLVHKRNKKTAGEQWIEDIKNAAHDLERTEVAAVVPR